MESKAIDKTTSDKICFITYIIPKFAADYKMGTQQAYQYLKQYGGLAFLMEHWWALHTDNDIWAVHDIYQICRNNGGLR